ncbi:MAG: four helix bundle protein [bacterium]|nr:four helix bundle protein [bacterium]
MQNSKPELKHRAYIFALDVMRFIDGLSQDQSSKIIANQLLRSATSIGANIIEAQASSTKKDFTNFFNHALKSANETKFWLGLLRDSGKAREEKVNQLLKETTELANILGSSILTLKGKRKL